MPITYAQAKEMLAAERELLKMAMDLFDIGASDQAMELLQRIPAMVHGSEVPRD